MSVEQVRHSLPIKSVHIIELEIARASMNPPPLEVAKQPLSNTEADEHIDSLPLNGTATGTHSNCFDVFKHIKEKRKKSLTFRHNLPPRPKQQRKNTHRFTLYKPADRASSTMFGCVSPNRPPSANGNQTKTLTPKSYHRVSLSRHEKDSVMTGSGSSTSFITSLKHKPQTSARKKGQSFRASFLKDASIQKTVAPLSQTNSARNLKQISTQMNKLGNA